MTDPKLPTKTSKTHGVTIDMFNNLVSNVRFLRQQVTMLKRQLSTRR